MRVRKSKQTRIIGGRGGIRTHVPELPTNWFRVISVWAILDDLIRNCWNIAAQQKADKIRLCENSKLQNPLNIWIWVKSDEFVISNIFLIDLLENSLEMAYFLPLWRSIGSAFLHLRLRGIQLKIVSTDSSVEGMWILKKCQRYRFIRGKSVENRNKTKEKMSSLPWNLLHKCQNGGIIMTGGVWYAS